MTPDLAEPLGQNRDFKVLLTSQGISSLGDAVSFTALPLLVLALTGSGFAMGVVGALQTLPDLFLAMLAGAIADRSDRKRMMFLADLGRAVLTALIPISVFLGGPTMAVILLVAAPMSVLSIVLHGRLHRIGAGARRTVAGRPRQLVLRGDLLDRVHRRAGHRRASSPRPSVRARRSRSMPCRSPSPDWACCFVHRDLRAPVDRPREHLLAEMREGIDFIRTDPTLRVVILFWGAVTALTAPLVTALAVYITLDLGLTASTLGLILSAYGVGTVGGALLMTRVGRQRPAPMLLGGSIANGMTLLVLALADSVPVFLGSAFVFGIAQSVVLLTYITLRTNLSPDPLLGRIGSTARTATLGLSLIGLLVGGLLIDATSGSTTIVLMGAALIIVSVVFATVPAMRRASARFVPG